MFLRIIRGCVKIFQLDRIVEDMKTTNITKCEYFGCDILGVLGSVLSLITRNKTKQRLVNPKHVIETRLGIQNIQRFGKRHHTYTLERAIERARSIFGVNNDVGVTEVRVMGGWGYKRGQKVEGEKQKKW